MNKTIDIQVNSNNVEQITGTPETLKGILEYLTKSNYDKGGELRTMFQVDKLRVVYLMNQRYTALSILYYEQPTNIVCLSDDTTPITDKGKYLPDDWNLIKFCSLRAEL